MTANSPANPVAPKSAPLSEPRKTPWTPGPWKIAANYVVTCREDGSIPLDSRIVAVVDKDVQTGGLLTELLDRANMAPALVEILVRVLGATDEDAEAIWNEARTLLRRIGLSP